MKKESKVWAISLIAFWFLAPNKINAQDRADSVRTLNDVVVTATKFPKSQAQTGKVLTVIDSTQLAHSAGKDLSQLLNQQVGLVVNGANSNPGKDKSVYLRGADSKYTLILMDGIPISDPSGVGGAFDLRLLPIDQIDHIEILKGSQSTLYGTDAIAGVINIITKQKGTKPFGGQGTVSYGSYNTSKAAISFSGNTKRVSYNVGYTHYNTDGISEAQEPEGVTGYDKDGYSQDAFNASLTISPTASLTIRPFIRYADFDGKYDGGSFTDADATYTSHVWDFGMTGQYSFGAGSLNLLASGTNTDRNFNDDYGTTPYSGKFTNLELYVNQDMGKYFQLLGGINYQKHQMDTSAFHIISPYVSLFVNNYKGFSMEVGGRYNNHSQFGNVFTYSVNPSYLVNSKFKIFANYSTGFKTPTLGELYGPFSPNPKLKAEESTSLEGGIQYIAPSSHFNVRATVFQRSIINAITYGSDGYENYNKQNDHGIEIEPTIKLSKLTLRGYYAFVAGEVTAPNRPGQDTTYNNLLRRPKHSVGVYAGYQISPAFFISANYKTFSNRLDKYFNNSDYQTYTVNLSAYQLLDVYAEYKLLKNMLTIFVDAKNVLNQQYVEVYGYSTMGANWNAGLSVKF